MGVVAELRDELRGIRRAAPFLLLGYRGAARSSQRATFTPLTMSQSINTTSASPPTGSTNHLSAIASGGYRKAIAPTPAIIIRTPKMRGRNVDLKIR